ncbi:MAG: dihydropteroate synthase, partial [Sphingomicrobium sp.]
MATRTLIRPTAFVDSPFGHDGKVAQLAGGLNWFSAVEVLSVEGNKRTAVELVAVSEIEQRLDEATAAQWQALTAKRAPLQLGERTVRLDQPQVMAVLNVTPD